MPETMFSLKIAWAYFPRIYLSSIKGPQPKIDVEVMRMMFRKSKLAILLTLTIAATSALTGCGTAATSATQSEDTAQSGGSQVTTLAYTEEMDKNEVMTFQISVDQTKWQEMLDNASAEEYISADITINGTTITNVGIRPKGNSSLSSIVRDDTTDRYSFKIKFDEYVDGQTWEGLDTIVLNNNFSDATSMKEYLSYDIMSYIGVDSPLYSYADISVNGETWGFYLAVEDLDDSYMERTHNDEGELYKPESDMGGGGMPDGAKGGQDGTAPDANDSASEEVTSTNSDSNQTESAEKTTEQMPDRQNGGGGMMGGKADNGTSLQYTDDEISSYSAIFDNAETKTDETDQQRLIAALKNLSEGTNLASTVDVEAVLKYFAAHTVVVNLDSYVSNMAHNYYLYENDGQISILPWDYNLAFGGFQSGSASDVVNFPIDTPVSGVSMEDRPLLDKLLENPDYLEQYHEYLQQIVDGYFADGKFEQTVDKLSTMISEYVKNDPSAFYTYDEFEAGVAELKELGALRAESIQGQLDGTIPSTTEGQEADSSALIDASSVDMQALGSQGGGGMGGEGGKGGFPDMGGIDSDIMQQAMQLIQDAGGEITDEIKSKLLELGLTEEQITMFSQMRNGGGQRPDGNATQEKS
ncbi:spore coat protein CotH [Paenibacillus cellulosilyticus]|uniref:Spore coat protein CotH n=2 Tax=Paenibacillus cellulosilyticus TaxID=375489 RepID=A0A2V2Z1M4_9BACL|nr:spore coat protein CotH [Paenibacillus cellulosilyticus]